MANRHHRHTLINQSMKIIVGNPFVMWLVFEPDLPVPQVFQHFLTLVYKAITYKQNERKKKALQMASKIHTEKLYIRTNKMIQ